MFVLFSYCFSLLGAWTLIIGLLKAHVKYPARLLCLLVSLGKNTSENTFLSPGDLPDPGIRPRSLSIAGRFFTI